MTCTAVRIARVRCDHARCLCRPLRRQSQCCLGEPRERRPRAECGQIVGNTPRPDTIKARIPLAPGTRAFVSEPTTGLELSFTAAARGHPRNDGRNRPRSTAYNHRQTRTPVGRTWARRAPLTRELTALVQDVGCLGIEPNLSAGGRNHRRWGTLGRRSLGATDIMALAELSKVPGVAWDTFSFLAGYIGAPTS